MNIHLIEKSLLIKAELGIAGHNGVMHSHSHSGFIQDDSAAFSFLVYLLLQACPMDLKVAKVECKKDTLRIELGNDNSIYGVGEVKSQKNFSIHEKNILQRACNQSAIKPHFLTEKLFGKIYGHGVSACASLLNLALSRAVLDSFKQNWGDTLYSLDDTPNSCGEFLGGSLFINGVAVNWLLTINASLYGTGPNEDAEGIIPIGNKGRLIEKLGLDTVPVLLLESKAYVPTLSKGLTENHFFIRYNKEYDNPVVAYSYKNALDKLGLKYIYDENAYPRDESLSHETKRIGKNIQLLGEKYSHAQTSAQKVEIATELASYIKEDIGGSLFMSDAIFKYGGAGGLWPGQSAMLSLLVSQEEFDKESAILLHDKEQKNMLTVICHAVHILYQNKEEAKKYVKERRPLLTPYEVSKLANI